MSPVLAGVAWAGVLADQPPPPGLERAYAPRRVALVVGIDAFDDPALGELRFAGKDAADLARVLDDPGLGGYDVVSVLTGTVTRKAFWSAFEAVAAGIQRDDTVVVYVASHGTLRLQGSATELLLMPSDGWLANPTTAIAVASIAETLEALPARRRVLVLDACYAGTGRSVLPAAVKERLDGFRGPVPAPAALRVSAFSAHLYAAHVHQPAIEDPTLQNGVYTHFLVQALRGEGDLDGDGLVEVMEAHAWARDHTLVHTGGSQVPWAEVVTVGRAEVFLAGDPTRRRASEKALLSGLEALPASAVVRVDGVARGAGALQQGVRRIEVTDADRRLFDGRIRVGPGEKVHLDRFLAARAARTRLTAGFAGSPDRAWVGALGASAAVDWLPHDPGGVRLGVVGLARVASPGLAPGRPFAAGSLSLGAGPAWSLGTTTLMPLLDAGVIWRATPVGMQGSVAAGPGARVATEWGRFAVAVDGRLSAFPAEGRIVAVPFGSLSAGYRL